MHQGKLVNTLDNERWIQCDVTPDRQAEVDRLVSGRTFLQQSKLFSGSSHASTNGHSANSNSQVSEVTPIATTTSTTIDGSLSAVSKKKETRPVLIDNSSFNVVWSVLLLAEIAMTYLDIACNFSQVTLDIISQTVELIRLFDTRTRQLVLSAGAIQSAAR